MAAAAAATTHGRRCDRPCRCTAASGTRRAAGWDCARRTAPMKGAPRRSTRPWRGSDGRSAACDMASSCAVAGGMSAVGGELGRAQRGGRESGAQHGGAAHDSGMRTRTVFWDGAVSRSGSEVGVGAGGLAARTPVTVSQVPPEAGGPPPNPVYIGTIYMGYIWDLYIGTRVRDPRYPPPVARSCSYGSASALCGWQGVLTLQGLTLWWLLSETER